jgi:hypothetical protein
MTLVARVRHASRRRLLTGDTATAIISFERSIDREGGELCAQWT